MVNLVIVSHSARLGEGVGELARQMLMNDGCKLAIAAGIDDPASPIGTDPIKVMEAIESVADADHVLVIYDDVSLPVGKLRVRPTGSAGGHNGIKNIIAHLGTQDFPRIKIGTGAPGEGGDMIDWVIGVPSQAERKILVESFENAVKAAEELEAPIILQIAEVRLKSSPLELMGPMMISAAENANVDIAVHLDHG